MLELVFTSAKEGLIPGRSGFCSVAWTEGMPQNFVALLENMSGYNALYMPNDPKADLNPVCYSYQKVQYGQNELRILSRIAFAGLDYTGRTNKIAHHIIIEDESELANLQHGPVSAFLCEENFITAWNEPPRLIPRRTRLKSAFTDGLRADHWLKLTGKPQWAGIVADSFLNSDEKSCLYLEYDNEAHREDVLYLIDEIARLLPQDVMADFTFNTYFSNVQNGINCFFRAALPNCPALPAIKRFKAKELISLINQTEPPGGNNSPLITAAVTGVAPVVEEKVVASQSDVYSQQMLELQQMRMRQQTQPPAKKIVYKDKNNNIGRQESSHTQVSNSMSPRIRLLLFTAGSLMLMILIGFGVWVTLELTAEPMEDSAPAQAETPATICETAQEEDKKAERNKEKQEPEMEQAQEKKPQTDGPAPTPPKQDIAEKKITEAPTPPKVAPKNQNIKLETKDLYELFKGFVKLEKKRTSTIPLPDVLKQTERFEVKINSWNKNVENSEIENFVKRESLCFVACDIKNDPDKGYYADENTILLNISLRDNKLFISGENMEEVLKCIESITFYTPTGKCTWKIIWKKDFVKLLKKGKFTNDLTFDKKAGERKDVDKIFHYIKVREKVNTSALRTAVKNYNTTVKNYNRTNQNREGEISKLYSWKDTYNLIEEIVNLLTPASTDIKYDTVKEKCKALAEHLKYLDPDDKKKISDSQKELEEQKKTAEEKKEKEEKDNKYKKWKKAREELNKSTRSENHPTQKQLVKNEENTRKKAKDIIKEIRTLENQITLLDTKCKILESPDDLEKIFKAILSIWDNKRYAHPKKKDLQLKNPFELFKSECDTIEQFRKDNETAMKKFKKDNEELSNRHAERSNAQSNLTEKLKEIEKVLDNNKAFEHIYPKIDAYKEVTLDDIRNVLNDNVDKLIIYESR